VRAEHLGHGDLVEVESDSALVFAVYALVLIPALLVFGQLSDRRGRRPVIALGLGLAEVALVFFAGAEGTAWLFSARAVLGVAQGMLAGAATAALVELVSDRPRRAALRATLGRVGGSAAGVLLCGGAGPVGSVA
jgi:MFS family permease